LKNTCTKHSKYVVIQKLEPVEDISFRELFGRIREVFYAIRSGKNVTENPFNRSYCVKHLSDSTKKFSETDIFNRLEFLNDNIFAMFGARVFQQTVGMPIGTNCAHFLANLFLYSHEADFIQGLLKKNEENLARSFNFTFCSIDDVLSLNNSTFGYGKFTTGKLK
jgi:hypothetical protein